MRIQPFRFGSDRFHYLFLKTKLVSRNQENAAEQFFLWYERRRRRRRRRRKPAMQARVPDPTPSPNPDPNRVLPPNAPPLAAAAAGTRPSMFPGVNPAPCSTPRGSHHRRARSEQAFRVPNDLDVRGGGGDPMAAAGSVDEIGSEDDLFRTFMDIEKIGCKLEASASGSEGGDYADPAAESSGCGEERKIGDASGAAASKPKHRHSSSVDGSSMTSSATMKREGVFGEVMEAKKAMTPEQLAELAVVDPKRAKR
ncbi:hypothetical protein BHM03_00042769 [Ensete ventricosum]|nr:hypothetical protein BHM03_00042769 [Ensete ventricosum]